ncbi:MAG: HEAT repeat domain-containing protein [Bacteroidales bacterium]|nr:HEAT repeat domain-containing protein [Bacteroidales bacterium]MBK7626660.1 HEAT repeat domain-containing protein [Bacteroidales bacterium]
MKCEEAEARIIDYIDNILDEEAKREVENHFDKCERCTDMLIESRKVIHLISNEETSTPDDSLRTNFYHMLHSEIRKSEMHNTQKITFPIDRRFNRSLMRIAAGIALLIAGTFLGMLIRSGAVRSAELDQLRAEVSELKKNTMFTMLNESSSSNRIQAVRYAEELEIPDQNVIDVLVRTLNNDKNINVRMAAAYALSKFADQNAVSDSLVKSLTLQQNPILQITLINILAEKNEKSAFKPIQQIIANKNTLPEVRVVAQNSLRTLI